MRVRYLSGLLLSSLLLIASGCGGGGGGSTTAGAPSGAPSGGSPSGAAPGTTLLSGTASKGPITGGTVRVFEIISSSTSNPRASIPRLGTTALAQGTTLADGSYSITLPAGGTKGGLMV